MVLRAVGLALALALAVSCGSVSSSSRSESTIVESSTTSPDTTVAPATTESTVQATTAPSSTSIDHAESAFVDDPADDGMAAVVLVDPGAEPRAEIRLSLVPGVTETMVVEQTQTIEITVDGLPLPSAGPIRSVTTSSVVGHDAGDGLIRLESVVTDAGSGEGTDPAIAAQMDAVLATVVGATDSAVIDALGRRSDVISELPADTDPMLAQIMEGLALGEQSTPLPAEAVGIGAVWRVEQVIPSNGLEILQTTEYELLARAEGNVFLSVEIAQTVQPGSVFVVPGEAPGQVVSWSGELSGWILLELTSAVGGSWISGEAVQVMNVGPNHVEQMIETSISVSGS